eukprot:4308427-Lingulodinium_polyedra.AAC.1
MCRKPPGLATSVQWLTLGRRTLRSGQAPSSVAPSRAQAPPGEQAARAAVARASAHRRMACT